MPRVFVALTLSEPIQQSVLFWRQNYTAWPVRWVEAKNLHVTVIPPWQETDLDQVSHSLEAVETTGPLEISFDKVSLGPDPKAPRLMWASGPTPPLAMRLKQNLETALRIAPSPRPFKLHLTLARFRRADYDRFPKKTLAEPVAWRDSVHSFALIESHLGPQGADYKILRQFLL